jgi:hypothetical protein
MMSSPKDLTQAKASEVIFPARRSWTTSRQSATSLILKKRDAERAAAACPPRYRCLSTGVTGSRSRPTPAGFGQIRQPPVDVGLTLGVVSSRADNDRRFGSSHFEAEAA